MKFRTPNSTSSTELDVIGLKLVKIWTYIIGWKNQELKFWNEIIVLLHKLHGFERLGDGVSERHLTEETKKGGGLHYLLSLTMASSDCLEDQGILEDKDLNQDNISTYNPSNDLESFNYDDMLNVVSYCSMSLGYDLNIHPGYFHFISLPSRRKPEPARLDHRPQEGGAAAQWAEPADQLQVILYPV